LGVYNNYQRISAFLAFYSANTCLIFSKLSLGSASSGIVSAREEGSCSES